MNGQDMGKDEWDVIIIGGGQSGLIMGYEMKMRNRDFLILEAGEKVGDVWHKRWDSLRLFTPNWTVNYPGMAFPATVGRFPDKNDVVRYLQEFAAKNELPVLHQMKATRLLKKGGHYLVAAGGRTFRCNKVIVATGNFSHPRIPAFAGELNSRIQQLHSSAYKRPAQLPFGNILVVGAATSGLQIALEIASTGRQVYVSGTPPAEIPPFLVKYFSRPVLRMMHKKMTIETKRGRKMRDEHRMGGKAAPLINISLQQVLNAGAIHVPRLTGVKNGYPMAEGDWVYKIAAIVWCTGFTRDFSWMGELDGAIDDHHYPVGERGVSEQHKGLYFLGMSFQFGLTSATFQGIPRDAAYIADHIQAHP